MLVVVPAILPVRRRYPPCGQSNRHNGATPLRDPKTLAETDGLPGGPGLFIGTAESSERLAKPVAYGHGDSHYFRIDKPFLDAQGMRLENFTRVETFGDYQENGDNDVDWLKVLGNADNREAFAYQEQIVPGNRTAVPAP